MAGRQIRRSRAGGGSRTVIAMQRRSFLHLAGGVALAGCAARGGVAGAGVGVGPARRGTVAADPIGAVAFDLFTIFDPRGVDRRVAEHVREVDAGAFAAAWKSRLFEYSWLRAAAGRYVAFDQLVVDALRYAERKLDVALAPAVRDQLAGAFTALEPWPDARDVLRGLRARGLRLAPLANFAPSMIAALLGAGGVTDLFEHQISTDAARTYKPDPRAYALAERAFALPRAQIAFAAFGGWDAAGAAWFGFPTFWVDRLGVTPEELGATDLATGADLGALATWLGAGVIEKSRSDP
jgi:2-haloacid dehalogenase